MSKILRGSAMVLKRIMDEVDRSRSGLLEFTRELVRIPSVNPPGDVSEAAEVLRSKVEGLGMETRLVEPRKGRVNVLAELKGRGEGPTLLFNGHTDVVPEGDATLWSVDPFSGEVKEGWLYGRGSSDMKGALASIATAVEAVVNSDLDLEGSVAFHGVADEEVGGGFGTRYLTRKHMVLADLGVVAEGSVFDGVIALRPAVRGVCWIRLETRGKAAHASNPGRGVNAVLSMSKLLLALQDLRLDLGHHRYLPDPTLSPGTVIKGGVKTNIIPELCTAEVDARTIPGVSEQMILGEVEKVMEKLKAKDPSFVGKAEIVISGKPAEISVHHQVVKVARGAAKMVVGYEPPLRGGSGSNDSSYLIHNAGVPTICGFGPGDHTLSNAHGADEKVSVKELVNFAKIYALMIAGICGGQPIGDV
ncbi:MAG: M20 family metallopeptidase [Candidatus Geothermarchaeales archaeon]